jgi:hypothetical protein
MKGSREVFWERHLRNNRRTWNSYFLCVCRNHFYELKDDDVIFIRLYDMLNAGRISFDRACEAKLRLSTART